ncbi:MAG: sugar phosphate nucleotidyltransferase [Nitrospinota bacterium]
MQRRELAVVILAAGKGKRMKSDRPKVLQLLEGKPLVKYVIDTANLCEPSRIVVIVGFGGDDVKKALSEENVSFAVQEEQLGTAHAVMRAEQKLESFEGDVMILSGDVPMVRAETLRNLMKLARETKSRMVFLSMEVEDPSGYGRVIRSQSGNVAKIVEERDALPEQKAVKEINGGIYLFDKKLLFELLPAIRSENEQKEYYLTDAVKMAIEKGEDVRALKLSDPLELRGVNRPEELEELRLAAARK